MALEYLADLKGPDLTHPWVGRVKHEGLHGAVGRPRGENELTGITFHIVLQTQTAHLDTVLVEEAWQGETFLLVQRLTEDDKLLKQEDSPVLHPAEQTALWIGHHERVLQQKAALSHDFPIKSL